MAWKKELNSCKAEEHINQSATDKYKHQEKTQVWFQILHWLLRIWFVHTDNNNQGNTQPNQASGNHRPNAVDGKSLAENSLNEFHNSFNYAQVDQKKQGKC